MNAVKYRNAYNVVRKFHSQNFYLPPKLKCSHNQSLGHKLFKSDALKRIDLYVVDGCPNSRQKLNHFRDNGLGSKRSTRDCY